MYISSDTPIVLSGLSFPITDLKLQDSVLLPGMYDRHHTYSNFFPEESMLLFTPPQALNLAVRRTARNREQKYL